MTECNHDGCESTDVLYRQTKGSGMKLPYCQTHDPLTDPRVSACFERVIGP